MGGSNYYCLHIDDFLDEVHIYFMAAKSDTFCNYKAYEAWARVQRGATHIRELQSNRGREYTGKDFNQHFAASGTIQRLTTHDSPQQNGKVTPRARLRPVHQQRAPTPLPPIPKPCTRARVVTPVVIMQPQEREGTQASSSYYCLPTLSGR